MFFKVVLSAVALWLTTLLLGPHLAVTPFGGEWWQLALTYLAVAAIFGIVNGIVGNFIRIVAFPVYILTLGLISLIVNGLLLWIVHWISSWLGWGLSIDGGFWWGVLGALVLGIINWILGLVFRPLIRREGRNRR